MIKLKSVTFDLLLLNMMNLMMSHEYRSVIRQQSQSVINYRHLRISRPVSRLPSPVVTKTALFCLSASVVCLCHKQQKQSVTNADRESALAFNSATD